MTHKEEVHTKYCAGNTAGIIACILAIGGILFFGIILIPPAAIVALAGTVLAVKNTNPSGIAICMIAWLLLIFLAFISPQR